MKRTSRTAVRSRHAPAASAAPAPVPAGWTFLTNHMHVLLCLYRQPDERLRHVAAAVGITERMVQRIVAELTAQGYLRITKVGRRNSYSVDTDRPLRHPLEMRHTIGELLRILEDADG